MGNTNNARNQQSFSTQPIFGLADRNYGRRGSCLMPKANWANDPQSAITVRGKQSEGFEKLP